MEASGGRRERERGGGAGRASEAARGLEFLVAFFPSLFIRMEQLPCFFEPLPLSAFSFSYGEREGEREGRESGKEKLE